MTVQNPPETKLELVYTYTTSYFGAFFPQLGGVLRKVSAPNCVQYWLRTQALVISGWRMHSKYPRVVVSVASRAGWRLSFFANTQREKLFRAKLTIKSWFEEGCNGADRGMKTRYLQQPRHAAASSLCLQSSRAPRHAHSNTSAAALLVIVLGTSMAQFLSGALLFAAGSQPQTMQTLIHRRAWSGSLSPARGRRAE